MKKIRQLYSICQDHHWATHRRSNLYR